MKTFKNKNFTLLKIQFALYNYFLSLILFKKAFGQYVTLSFKKLSLKGQLGSVISNSLLCETNSSIADIGLFQSQSREVLGPPHTCFITPSQTTI